MENKYWRKEPIKKLNLDQTMYTLVTEEAKKYLGICAIATIADIVPLNDENRAIVKFGMADFDKNLPVGIKMLMKDNKLDCNLNSTDIAFLGMLANLHIQTKQYEKAKDCLRKICTIKEDFKTITTLGNLEFQTENYDKAIAILEKALSIGKTPEICP